MRIQSLFTLGVITCIIAASCNKDVTSTKNSSLDAQSNDDVTVFTERADNGLTSVTIRPNLKNGQDVDVLYYQDHPVQTATNFNYQHELQTVAWTDGGSFIKRRSFIRFDSLAKIPDTAKIISAKLILHGSNSSIEVPQGNSYYPGSPYSQFGDNACYVERVVGAWDQTTVNWNNQPRVTELNRAVLKASNKQWGYNTVIDVTQLVKTMVKNPSKNFGFRIALQSEAVYRSILFYTSENSDATKRPRLEVIYK